MSEHDRSLIDRVKDALGMGEDRDERESREHPAGEPIQTERPAETASEPPAAGATQASGWEGASGGTGASGAMGGAGASGPVGTTPPGDETDDLSGADTGRVRTEYEMGHELDPDHETRAESGVLGPSGSGSAGEADGGIRPETRGEAASGRSPFDDDEDDASREPR